jgi:hypothetical protein
LESIVSTKTWLRISVFLTLPSLGLSIAALIILCGNLADTRKQLIEDQKRFDKLASLIVASSSDAIRSTLDERDAGLTSSIDKSIKIFSRWSEASADVTGKVNADKKSAEAKSR